MSNFLEGLNNAQREAVEHTNGPALIIAGAGAGKTRVLTLRIANLMEQGVRASSILALTFTNKAAREMQERIGTILSNGEARYLWMGTFHSIFARILRAEAVKLGYPSSFSIYDTTDTKSLLRSITRELQLDDKIYKAGDIYSRISSAKNNLITPQAYYNSEQIRERDRLSRKPMLHEIFKLYAARCKKAGAMDFDDLLLNMNILLRDFPEVLQRYQEKFRYILVDEYQDTNYAQYLIVKRLGELHKNVCVVGDDAQSIYSFRGAKIENILNFKVDYPHYNLYKLEQNYRSTQNIVDAANSIIKKNEGQIQKTVYSENEQGNAIQIIKTLTDIEEGFMVSNSIMDTMLSDRLKYNDFAILYRTNAQSRIFEEALRKRNIPYKVYGSISFYQRKEIKDLISYLRLLVNPADDEALKRVINYPTRGIGASTLSKIEEFAACLDQSMWQVIENLGSNNPGFNKGTISKIEKFVELIRAFSLKVADNDAYEIASQMAKASGILQDLYNGNSPEERSKYENLEELLNGIRDFTESAREEGSPFGLQNFLENVALLTDADTDKAEDKNKVSIMTMHSAKGLEFSNVYLVGLEEELFPSPMAIDNMQGLEEERRLFYVGVTRAKKSLTISYAQSRYRWGVPADCVPSRFLRDIDERFIEWADDPRKNTRQVQIQEKFLRRPTDGNYQREVIQFSGNARRVMATRGLAATKNQDGPDSNEHFIASEPESIQLGMVVEHQRFGRGKVVHIEGEMPNKKATVFFQQIKQGKQLLLKFAKLRIIENQ